MSLDNQEDGVALRNKILDVVAGQKEAHFKSQQRGEDELTFEERREIAGQWLDRNPAVFLQRFGSFVDPHMFVYFENLQDDDGIIKLQISNLKRFKDKNTSKMRVKNRRYEALNQLIADGKYFSDSQMQIRNPLLYEQMIGNFLDDKERNDLALDNMLERHGHVSFSTFLMEQIEKSHIEQKRMEQKFEESGIDKTDDEEESEEEEEESEEEEEEESESEDEAKMIACESRKPNLLIDAKEKIMLREEFNKIMYEHFLNGEDAEFFDYNQVDLNPEYDSRISDRDEEDKYFDSETPD